METDLLLPDPSLVEVGDEGYTPGTNLLLDWILANVYAAQPHVNSFKKKYAEARRFFDGKQMSKEDKEKLAIEGRPNNAFNSAQKFVRFITGVERTAPEALLFSPLDENDDVQQQLGEFATRTYDWALNIGNGDFERSTAFEDLIVGGMGWVSPSIEYGRDPRGLPMYERFSPTEALWPQTNRQNLEGSRWRARESWVDKDEAKARWFKQRSLINQVLGQPIAMSRPEASSPIVYTIPNVETVPISDAQLINPQRDKVLIMQFEWFDDEQGYYFFDPLENSDAWLNDADFAKYRRRLKLLMKQDIVDYMRRPSRQYKRQFVLNRRELLGDSINLKRFHLNCMTGSYDDEEKVFYGYFRVLIDPQRFANKFFNQIIEIMGHTAKGGGFLYEKGTFEPNQLKDFTENYSKPGTSQEVKSGAIAGRKLMPKPAGELPQASVAMMQLCVQMMDNVTGISPDQYGGGANQNVAGVTVRQKAKASLLLLSKEFDALSRFRISEGNITLNLLQSLADDRLIRVGGHADGQVVKLSRQPFELEYSLSLDDTERDPNIRKMYEEAVMQIAPTLIRTQMFLPELLDYMRLPYRFKNALKKAISSAYQARQIAAQQGIPQGGRSAPKTPEERQADIQKANAEAMANVAKANRLASQSQRDKERMIMDALVKMFEINMAGKQDDRQALQDSLSRAQSSLDIFHQTIGADRQPKVPTKRRSTTSSPRGQS